VEKLLTPKQLSELLQVKLSTVYKWVHYGYVPHIKIGDLIRFRERKLRVWLNHREQKGRTRYKLTID